VPLVVLVHHALAAVLVNRLDRPHLLLLKGGSETRLCAQLATVSVRGREAEVVGVRRVEFLVRAAHDRRVVQVAARVELRHASG
jgi:hypothetical protein